MVQAFPSLPTHWSNRILCYYCNTTNHLQAVQITNIAGWCYARLVFPKQRLLFEAVPEAVLEIHVSTTVGQTLHQQIPCAKLQVNEAPDLTCQPLTIPS